MIDYSELNEAAAKFMPTPEYIAHMQRVIREENESARQGRAYQPPVDDCDAELEVEADRACGGVQ